MTAVAPHFEWLDYTGARPNQPPVVSCFSRAKISSLIRSQPAERHADLFNDAVAPRGVSFNPEEPSGASYLRNFTRLNSTLMYDLLCCRMFWAQCPACSEYNDHWYRQRIRSLQAVDELVEAVYKKLEAADALDNT